MCCTQGKHFRASKKPLAALNFCQAGPPEILAPQTGLASLAPQ